jgi:hypothetical protein
LTEWRGEQGDPSYRHSGSSSSAAPELDAAEADTFEEVAEALKAAEAARAKAEEAAKAVGLPPPKRGRKGPPPPPPSAGGPSGSRA